MMRLLSAIVVLGLALAPSSAAPGLFGEPGLVLIPTADPVQHGEYAVGVNSVDEAYRRYPQLDPPPYHATVCHYLNVGVVPAVDVTFRLTNFDGKLFAQFAEPGERPAWVNPWGYPVGGYNVDRSLGVRLQVLAQRGPWPAIAVGARDVTGTSYMDAHYLVFTRRFPARADTSGRGWGLHAGFGTDALDGVFAGIDFHPTGRVGVVAEHVASDLHLGVRWNLTQHLQLQPSLLGFRSVSAGLTWVSRL
ncbi:MAG: YjbH domain-containing protein [Armatimonadota bacterium]|nr:YjbH domain-containing protein [Armatimonadota bacterium]